MLRADSCFGRPAASPQPETTPRTRDKLICPCRGVSCPVSLVRAYTDGAGMARAGQGELSKRRVGWRTQKCPNAELGSFCKNVFSYSRWINHTIPIKTTVPQC